MRNLVSISLMHRVLAYLFAYLSNFSFSSGAGGGTNNNLLTAVQNLGEFHDIKDVNI